MNVNQIYNSECLQGLKYLPDNSIHCCVTSPPYYALRDYGDDAQIGLEKLQKNIFRSWLMYFERFVEY